MAKVSKSRKPARKKGAKGTKAKTQGKAASKRRTATGKASVKKSVAKMAKPAKKALKAKKVVSRVSKAAPKKKAAKPAKPKVTARVKKAVKPKSAKPKPKASTAKPVKATASRKQPRAATAKTTSRKGASVPQGRKPSAKAIKEELLKRRTYLLNNLGKLTAATSAGGDKPVGDRVDDASLDLETDSTYSIVEQESRELRHIDSAIEKVSDGSYGICEECGEPIEKARLEALPYALLCLKCKQAEEVEHTRSTPAVYGDYDEE